MPFPHRLVSLLIATATVLGPAAYAGAPAVDPKAEVAAIWELAQDSPRAALDRVQTARRDLGANAPYEARQALLRTETWLREDLGQQDAAYTLERESLQLAQARGDMAGAALARLAQVRELLDAHRLDDAQALLDKIVAQAPKDTPLQFKVSVERAQGDIFNLRARFDDALAAYLRGLRLLQGRPGESGRRAVLYARIAQVYVNADNPAKAIDSADLGLVEKKMSLRPLASLQFTRAIALVRLGRDREGIAAFENALATAVRAGLQGMEAAARGNIADYYLQHHDYVRAEAEARKALAVSEKGSAQNLIQMARANLGFSLMGQGRIDAGLPWVDGVIAHLRKEKLTGDLEAMLDEKGRMLERAGQYQQALAAVREQQSLQQQDARATRDRAIATLQEEFDAHRRSQQIALLQRENRLKDAELSNRRTVQLATTFAAVLTVLAGAVVTVLYRRTARSNARLKELNVQLEFGSTHDALTGLHNRRSLTNRMSVRKDERRHPVADAVDCFVLVDIDHFKSINDRWGHGAGDAVLVDIARRLAAAVRDTDMVVRWGGEEFMIHAPAMDPASIAGMAERILDAVGGKPVDAGTCAIPVTLTAGIVALAGAGTAFDWQCAVRLADWALYQGKAQGRNQARIVTRLYAPADTVMAALDRDGADVASWLALACVHGPRQPVGRPAAAATRDTAGGTLHRMARA
ncbi:diguanylate cyclase [Telluria mixta]|uniref:diguanylate cyclase n=1 Tax=Telluria mixta TaxID=34071 RepID=A0ABT2C5D1_9BURK|nr:GGDEF domain-containing protein [Telluria mixta]MCS0632593.1 diguanylate cyclase [Telluria mixta]WEM99115.1 diguanylate cyclase [Telluria mixta]